MSEPRKPSLGFWFTIFVVSLPFSYVLSFGPACGLVDTCKLPAEETARFYRPLVRTAVSSTPVAGPLRWYGELFAPDYGVWFSGRAISIVDVMDQSLDDASIFGGEVQFDSAEEREPPPGDPTPRGTATEGP